MFDNYEVINFKNNKIYKVKVNEIDNISLNNEIKNICDYLIGQNTVNNTNGTGPGIQIPIPSLENEIIQDCRRIFISYCDIFFNLIHPKRKKLLTFRQDWIFISKPENLESSYHDHTNFVNEPYLRNIKAEYTYTYYAQMPDNLEGNDGVLYFKEKKEDPEEFSILPEQGYLYFFDSKLFHRPEISKSSKTDRIVIASAFAWVLERDKNVLI